MEYVRVAALQDIVEGEGLRCETPAEPVALFRVGDDIYCIDDTCSHAQASLSEGEQQGTIVTCPLHGGQFDLRSGRVARLPAIAPVHTHPVKIVDGEILVGIEAEEDDD